MVFPAFRGLPVSACSLSYLRHPQEKGMPRLARWRVRDTWGMAKSPQLPQLRPASLTASQPQNVQASSATTRRTTPRGLPTCEINSYCLLLRFLWLFVTQHSYSTC